MKFCEFSEEAMVAGLGSPPRLLPAKEAKIHEMPSPLGERVRVMGILL
jgi:hypothetical protein